MYLPDAGGTPVRPGRGARARKVGPRAPNVRGVRPTRVDFEKAFDSVDHDFTFKMMSKLGMPNNFCRWARLAFTNTTASCIVNGTLTRKFALPGGGRQGDNLYPLIFAMVMHGLTVAVQECPARGVRIPGTIRRAKIKQYVDDSALFASNQADIEHYIEAVKLFERASGMKVNWDKTDGMYIGANAANPPTPHVTVTHADATTTTISFAKDTVVGHTPGPQGPEPIRHLKYNTRLRYLGVIMGPKLPPNHNWALLKPKLWFPKKRKKERKNGKTVLFCGGNSEC